MIEAIVMIAAGFAILYWAFHVSDKRTEAPGEPTNPKGTDRV